MNVGELFVRMAVDQKQYEKDLGKMEGITQKKAMTLGSIFKGAFSFALGIGLLQGFRSLGSAVTDFVNTAARTEVLDIAMRSVAKSSGYAIAVLNEQRKSVMELGIAEQEATQILTRFMQAQLDTADASRLARVAQDAAVIAGYNSSQAAEQMTEAIAKQRPELLSAFGMTRNMNEIYKDYAKTVGKTTKQLTESEKKQAMLNYILKEGEKIAGTYEASMGVVGKQISSLPRYWDTLKNAIAKPLALPVISVIVDGITNSLKNAISWAEANTSTLQRWGQTAVNVATLAGRGFSWVTGVLKRHWQTVRFAGTSLLFYVAATRTAAAATAIFKAVVLALNGGLAVKIPLLSLVSTAMGIYRVQMALGAAQGVVLTGVMAKLRVALYAVQTAMGPIGWILMGLSVIVAGGMSLWNKYNQTLQKTPKVSDAVKAATGGATKAFQDQADAMKEAGKAANKNLQAFDEVHQLQEDMGGSGEDMLDLEALLGAGVPGLDFEDMFAGLEEEAMPFGERVKGFFGWLWDGIKTGATTAWDWITGTLKSAWDGIVSFVKPVWEPIASFFSVLWDRIVSTAKKAWEPLASFFSGLWEGIKSVAETIWNIIVFALAFVWFSVVEIARTIFGPLMPYFTALWEGIKSIATTVWNGLASFFSTIWNTIVAVGTAIWSVFGPFFSTLFEGIKIVIVTIWSFIASFLVSLWQGIATTATTIWNSIFTFLTNLWNAIRNTAVMIWNLIKRSVENPVEAARKSVQTISENLRKAVVAIWDAIKEKALNIWELIKKYMIEPIEGARSKITGYVESLKNRISEAWDAILSKIRSMRDSLYRQIVEPWETAKERILGIVRDAYSWGKNLIQNFINGVKAKWDDFKTSISNVASTISGFLGFSSPTEEGPGRDADKWAPNLIKMYAKGITGGTSEIRSAVNKVAGQLTGLTAQPMIQPATLTRSVATATASSDSLSDGMAQAVYRAIMDALRISQASQSADSGDREVVLKLDSSIIARILLPAIIKEGQRQGLNLVVRPQGAY